MENGKEGPGRQRDALQRAASRVLLALVKKAAAAVPEDVGLLFFGSDGFPGASLDTLQICQFLSESGPRIKLRVFDAQTDRARCAELRLLFFPALIIEGKNRGSMRFTGTPAGYGLKMLVDALAAASTGEPGLSPPVRRKLEAVTRPLELKVFISPESEYCVRSALFALRLAVGSPHVRTEVINHLDFPVMSQMYRIGRTPRTFVNERLEINGALGEDECIEKLLGALVPQAQMHR